MGKNRKPRRKDKIQWSTKKLKKMLLITALLIIPPFVLWGISTAVQSNKNYFIGKIGNWRITRPLWRRTLNHTRIDLFLKTGQLNLNPKLIEQFAKERLLLLYDAKQKHIKVSDQELAEYIQSLPLFQDKTGHFSLLTYRRLLSYYGLREKDFEETLRENLNIQKLQQKVASNISISEKEIQQAWRKEKEKLKIKYHISPAADYLPKVQVSQQEISSYYKEHQKELIIPEKFKIAYIQLPKAKISKIEKKHLALEQLAKKFNLPIQQIQARTAEQIISLLHLNPSSYNTIISMKENQTSPPLPTINNNSYVIISITKIIPKHKASLTEATDIIKKKLRFIKAQQLAKESAENLLKSKQKTSINSWPETKEFSYYSYIPKLGPAQIIFEWLYKHQPIKQNHFYGPIKISSNFAIIYILNYKPAPAPIPKKEKERIKEKLLQQKQAEKFQQYIYNLKLKTSITGSLSELD